MLWSPLVSLAQPTVAPTGCGEVVTIETHGRTTTRYALVLLVGGGGHLNLDDTGCPRALMGNSLVRSLPLFHAAGFATALVDAPSDHSGDDGLAGFRNTAEPAEDLGQVIADVRRRTQALVWLVGTSRPGQAALIESGIEPRRHERRVDAPDRLRE